VPTSPDALTRRSQTLVRLARFCSGLQLCGGLFLLMFAPSTKAFLAVGFPFLIPAVVGAAYLGLWASPERSKTFSIPALVIAALGSALWPFAFIVALTTGLGPVH
jgi:hypothetical protein